MSNIQGYRPLSADLLPEISERASTHYRTVDPLEYHPYEHVKDTQGYLEQIIEELKAQRIIVDRLLGFVILEYHDAGYDKDHLDLGFPTKEAYSASIAKSDLTELRIYPSIIELVVSGVNDTHIDGVPQFNTSRATRLADVGNAADVPSTFQLNMIRFAHDEVQMGRELPPTFREFCARSKMFLGRYYEPVEFARNDGLAVVLEKRHDAARENLESLDILKLEEVLELTGMTLRPELAGWLVA